MLKLQTRLVYRRPGNMFKSNQIKFIQQQRAWGLLQVAKTFNTVRIKPTSITCIHCKSPEMQQRQRRDCVFGHRQDVARHRTPRSSVLSKWFRHSVDCLINRWGVTPVVLGGDGWTKLVTTTVVRRLMCAEIPSDEVIPRGYSIQWPCNGSRRLCDDDDDDDYDTNNSSRHERACRAVQGGPETTGWSHTRPTLSRQVVIFERGSNWPSD